jgi:hypothetical protein
MTAVVTTNPAALHAKYPVEGICTVDGVVTAWPEGLPTLTQALVDEAEAEWTQPKRPLKRWALRFALADYITTIDQIIAAMPNGAQKAVIAAKWAEGDVFEFYHADMQAMMPALLAADADFDADAIWAAGEAAQYGGDT